MYIKQTANTLRTFGECFLNTHEIGCEHSANSHVHHEIGCETLRQFPTSTTKWGANTPSIPHVHPRNGVRTLCQFPTSTHEMGCEHSARRRGPIHRARILTLPIAHICITKSGIRITESIFFSFSNLCLHFTACTFHITIYIYPIHQIRTFALSHTCFHITKYVYIRYQICISTLSITCFHLTTHTSLHYHTNIFVFCCL